MNNTPHKTFAVLLTRDVTQSARIPVAASSVEEAMEIAERRHSNEAFNHVFALCEGNVWEAPYCGAFHDDVEPLSDQAFAELVSQTDASLRHYTVVLLYPERATGDFGADIFVRSARAETPADAVAMVQHEANELNTDIPPDEFRMIAVFPGDLPCVMDATSPLTVKRPT